MRIRDAEARDLPDIERIEAKCFSVPWTMEMLESQLNGERNVFLVAEADGAAAGYIGLQYVLDEGYITNVAVPPDFRRRGIASALLETMTARARELKLAFMTLEVRASNTPAKELYARHGFIEVGRRRNYYEKPTEDAILMTLYISEE